MEIVTYMLHEVKFLLDYRGSRTWYLLPFRGLAPEGNEDMAIIHFFRDILMVPWAILRLALDASSIWPFEDEKNER